MALDYLSSIGANLGFPLWLTVVLLIWTIAWKLTGLWMSARNKHVVWFIVMGVVNTLGIIPILYIFIFSKLGKKNKMKKGSTGMKAEMKMPKESAKKPKKKVSRKKK